MPTGLKAADGNISTDQKIKITAMPLNHLKD